MAEQKLDTKWWVSVIIQIIVYVVAVMVAYGNLDKRLVTVEIKQETKVDGERLEKQLNQVKQDILNEMKKEFNELKKR